MTTSLAGTVTPKEEGSNVLGLWSKMWKNNATGWHKADVHQSLLKYGQQIIPDFDKQEQKPDGTCAEPVRVFVPLCGKTVDLAFLAKHGSVSHVVGVDGIKQALQEFSDENPTLNVQEEPAGPVPSYDKFAGSDITLLKGDFFGLDETHTGGQFDAVWDRASLVAINPTLREDYVSVMKKLVKPGGSLLVSTLERREGTEEAKKAGPPFSVPEAEVRRLYEGQDWVESVTLLEEVDEFEANPKAMERMKQMGVTSFFELMFIIKTKA